MARGLYSALGWWPAEELATALERLSELARRISDGADDTPTIRAASDAIRAFEAQVGARTGLVVERVSTPEGPAIELGNIDHVGFGAAHEDAASEVAMRLQEVLRELGASRTMWFTMD